MQGHAGTVPMHLRQDPMAGAAEIMHWLEQRCTVSNGSHGLTTDVSLGDALVCTVGSVSVWPGASNVIPAAVNISVDIRCLLQLLMFKFKQFACEGVVCMPAYKYAY